MDNLWELATNSVLKRTLIILVLVLLAYFTAFLWPIPAQAHIFPVMI